MGWKTRLLGLTQTLARTGRVLADQPAAEADGDSMRA